MPEQNKFDLQLINNLIQEKSKVKKEKNFDKLTQFLLQFKIFKIIYQRNGMENFKDILKNFKLKKYNNGDIIYDKPQNRTFNYVIQGTTLLFINKPYNKETILLDQIKAAKQQQDQQNNLNELYFYKKIIKNQYFGERMHISKVHKILCAKVVTDDTILIQIDLATLYKTFVGFFSFKQLQAKVNFLKRVPALKNLSTRKIERILEMSNTKKFTKNTIIFKEGEIPEYLMIMITGTIILTKNISDLNVFIKKFDISILSKLQTLGLQQVMKNIPYKSTATCTSQEAELLLIKTQIVRSMIDIQTIQQLQVQREKQYWRKIRFQSLEDISNILKKQTKNQQEFRKFSQFRAKTEMSNQKLEFSLADRQKLMNTQMQKSASNVAKQIKKKRKLSSTSQKKQYQPITNPGNELFTKYVQKKYKSNFKIFKKYAQTNPPELLQNPQKVFSIVKPLYVKRSLAIKNTKRQLKASRRHVYYQFLNNFNQ